MPIKKPTPTEVFQIKVTLERSKPPIWRRLLVKPDMTLARLHVVLQVVMGWENYHMHLFEIGGERYSHRDSDSDQMSPYEDHDESKAKLSKVFSKVKSKMIYRYDFGDDWNHLIVLEKVVPLVQTMKYPAVIAGKRRCPPEDCGGMWGYYDLLEILANPKHREYKERMQWIGGPFDPEDFSVNEANVALHGGWSRR